MRPTTRTSLGIAIVGLVAVVIIGAVILETTDHDPSRIFGYAVAVVPVLLLQLFQNEARAKDTAELKSAVNGDLTERLQKQTEEIEQRVANLMDSDPKRAIDEVPK